MEVKIERLHSTVTWMNDLIIGPNRDTSCCCYCYMTNKLKSASATNLNIMKSTIRYNSTTHIEIYSTWEEPVCQNYGV